MNQSYIGAALLRPQFHMVALNELQIEWLAWIPPAALTVVDECGMRGAALSMPPTHQKQGAELFMFP